MTVAEQEEVGKAALEYGKWLGEIAVFISECGLWGKQKRNRAARGSVAFDHWSG